MDLADYKIVTITHQATALETIGDFLIKHDNEEYLKIQLIQLQQKFDFKELLYVPTCNRVIYLFHTSIELNTQFILSFFLTINPNLTSTTILQNVKTYQGINAVEHLFRVGASIDSMVVGERQIIKQIRDSIQQSRHWGFSNKYIRFLEKHLVETTKEIFSTTRLGAKQVSVVSLATQKLLQSNLPKDAKILLIGAGQTNKLVAKILLKYGYQHITVFNRTLEKAQYIAAKFQGAAFSLQQLAHYKGGFDCLIICTGATSAIIDNQLYKTLLNGDKRTKLVIDLAIPYNVAPSVAINFPVQYINIELLKELAAQNLYFRKQEIKKAAQIIALRLEQFQIEFNQRKLLDKFSCIPKEIKNITQQTITKDFSVELAQLSSEEQALILKMIKYMEKKYIGIPMQMIKKTIGT